MENSIPWIEKYRPMDIDDIIMDDNTRQQINIFLQDRENVHLIITGLPGIGKTSTVRCIARKILGNNLTAGYLELISAEDRSIRNICTIIAPFCKKVVEFANSKIILLDEADSLTPKQQCDINNLIKQHGKKTKFIFTCNESSKIMEDIQSVCSIIKFKKLNKDQINIYLTNICLKENIEFDEDGLSTIFYISDGDMRKSINDLQKTAYTFAKITKDNVLNICKIPDPEEIKKIINLCFEEKLVEADTEMNNIIMKGYYYLDIISGFILVLLDHDINEKLRLKLIKIVKETKVLISIGLRTKLQLTAMICKLINEINY